MIIPVKCFSCNRLIADKYEEYIQIKEGEEQGSDKERKIQEFFKQKRIKRSCCKKLFLTHVDLLKKLT